MNLEYISFLKKVGIHTTIVDQLMARPVPVDNLYWENQEVYMDKKVRFLSIPFWLQICFQNGIPLAILLSEHSLQVMEEMLHYAEQEEQKQLSWEDCATQCQNIAAIQASVHRHQQKMPELLHLIAYYPNYTALRRGNFLVFHSLLVCTSFEQALYLSRVLIDMISCGCVIDDVYDAHEDRQTGEANIVIELGDDLNALNTVREIFYEKMEALQKHLPRTKAYLEEAFNSVVANYIFHQ